MKKYNEKYFSVINKRTGKKICDCADMEDALMMVSFDSENRIIKTNKMLMGQVVDVETLKALPTNEIIVNMDGAVGDQFCEVKEPEKLSQIKLPENQQEPVVI